jgi:type 1 glutamine amidotransferase
MKKNITRRNFFNKTFAASTIPFIMPRTYFENLNTNDPKPSLKDKKVLFVYGGWGGHFPKKSKELFVPLMESEGAKVTLSETLDIYLDEKKMMDFDLIVQAITMGNPTPKQLMGLIKTVKSGVGFTGWHGGISDSFVPQGKFYRAIQQYQSMVGGFFIKHPGGHIDFDVKIINKNDYITEGISDFKAINTEQYYMLVDPNIKVLATSKFYDKYEEGIGGSTMPVAWKKNYGKGRIFFQSIGHHLKEFEIFEIMEIQKRGMRWAAESKYHSFENCISPAYL